MFSHYQRRYRKFISSRSSCTPILFPPANCKPSELRVWNLLQRVYSNIYPFCHRDASAAGYLLVVIGIISIWNPAKRVALKRCFSISGEEESIYPRLGNKKNVSSLLSKVEIVVEGSVGWKCRLLHKFEISPKRQQRLAPEINMILNPTIIPTLRKLHSPLCLSYIMYTCLHLIF